MRNAAVFGCARAEARAEQDGRDMQRWAPLHDLRWPGGDVRHFELRARRGRSSPLGLDPLRRNDAWARSWLDRLEQPATGFALLRIYLGLALIVGGALVVSHR